MLGEIPDFKGRGNEGKSEDDIGKSYNYLALCGMLILIILILERAMSKTRQTSILRPFTIM